MKTIIGVVVPIMTTERTMVCPKCGIQNECHSDPTGSMHTPSDGAFGVCISCGVIGVYTNNATRQRLATDEEIDALPDDFRKMVMLLSERIEQENKGKS